MIFRFPPRTAHILRVRTETDPVVAKRAPRIDLWLRRREKIGGNVRHGWSLTLRSRRWSTNIQCYRRTAGRDRAIRG